MATTIFLVLNGLGVVFLVYVLANFWREGRRAAVNSDRQDVMEFRGRNWADAVVVTHPISLSAQGGVSVIPFQMRNQETNGNPTHKVA
jgi:hypothetical protein